MKTITDVVQSAQLALIMFAAAMVVAFVGGLFGYAIGINASQGECYRIKTERCLGEPIETECVCNGAEVHTEIAE